MFHLLIKRRMNLHLDLHRCCGELHPKQWTKVEIMDKHEFRNTFEMEWPLCGVKENGMNNWRRILAIVPLKLSDDRLLPLPFVVLQTLKIIIELKCHHHWHHINCLGPCHGKRRKYTAPL